MLDICRNYTTESEIEMAKILQTFILSNSHLFSDKVLAAALHLMEEVTKLEETLQ